MRKISLVLMIIFACFTGCAGQAQEQAGDPYTFDFGKVKEGQVMEHSFILVNKSVKVLNIKNTGTSCGCTVLEVGKKILKPQESVVIKTKFNSKGYSGPTLQYIYVYTDDLDNPLIRYIIKADVIKQ
ncbi:MAG: DUF1573 domain-containing protein [Candidatus Omnitrophica bacterium]|nr:DUF1573 domain-containing protein [Candidatus Omnitrophota bacterium]